MSKFLLTTASSPTSRSLAPAPISPVCSDFYRIIKHIAASSCYLNIFPVAKKNSVVHNMPYILIYCLTAQVLTCSMTV